MRIQSWIRGLRRIRGIILLTIFACTPEWQEWKSQNQLPLQSKRRKWCPFHNKSRRKSYSIRMRFITVAFICGLKVTCWSSVTHVSAFISYTSRQRWAERHHQECRDSAILRPRLQANDRSADEVDRRSLPNLYARKSPPSKSPTETVTLTTEKVAEKQKSGIVTLALPPRFPRSIKNSNNVNQRDTTQTNRIDPKLQDELIEAQMKYNLHNLRKALEKHVWFIRNSRLFSRDDIETIIDSIFVAAKMENRLIIGAADFLTLLLSVEEYDNNQNVDPDFDYSIHDGDFGFEDDDEGDELMVTKADCEMVQYMEYHTIMTRDALIASAFHYCECIVAREAGIYDIIGNLMRTTTTGDGSPFEVYANGSVDRQLKFLPSSRNDSEEVAKGISGESQKQLFDPPSVEVEWDGMLADGEEYTKNDDNSCIDNSVNAKWENEEHTKLLRLRNRESTQQNPDHSGSDFSIEQYGQDAVRISQSAAKIKQVEIMSHSILPDAKVVSTVTPTPSDAASKRGLLLSMADDWRALAIRSSACLYNLRGVLHHDHGQSLSRSASSSPVPTFGLRSFTRKESNGESSADSSLEDASYTHMQIIREAREALYVYAPLAERLGMHQLKAELENTAFRVLYRRQFTVAKSLYAKSGTAIQSVTTFLTENIEQLLKQDPWLSSQLDRLTVSSRVKNPYSLWKKLLRIRAESRRSPPNDGKTLSKYSHDPYDSINSDDEPSITLVQDAIAMRVILKSKKTDPNEDENVVKSREEFLCYYVQNRLMQLWPAVNTSRIKDYISMPKPNGYQSLHHTSQIFRYGCEWPFEVQIRTEDMHKKSEYGVAAHWDYKLKGRKDPHLAMVERQGNRTPIAARDASPFLLSGQSSVSNEKKLNELDEMAASVAKVDTFVNGSIKSLSRSSALESYIDALSSARKHLLDNSIFVFFLSTADNGNGNQSDDVDNGVSQKYMVAKKDQDQGRVIGLPSRSSVSDALVEICARCDLNVPKAFDASDFDVYVNGKVANLHDLLENGDVLIVPGLDRRISRYLM